MSKAKEERKAWDDLCAAVAARSQPGMMLDCGHVAPERPETGSTGYGWNADDGKTFCYPCAAARDREAMASGNRWDGYLVGTSPVSGDRGVRVSNWCGSLSIRVDSIRRSKSRGFGPWPIVRYDVWFRDHTGAAWWGVNRGDNQIVRCRKVKR